MADSPVFEAQTVDSRAKYYCSVFGRGLRFNFQITLKRVFHQIVGVGVGVV